MTEQVILAGFGGQGVLLAGQVLAHAGFLEDKNVSWLPSYGPEMRGGTANCAVIVSDEDVGSPIIVEADAVIVMNRPSFDKYEKYLKKGGLLVVNSTLIDQKARRDDIDVIYVPANELAEQAGNVKAANMAALGAYIERSGVVGKKSVIQSLKSIMGKKKAGLIPLNEKALDLGAACAK
jgi:2-oxoglutarate ferredoxin oxidoreductase subunit gamma